MNKRGNPSCIVMTVLFASVRAVSQFVTWLPPAEAEKGNTFIAPSSQYNVQLIRNGQTTDCFVYRMNAMQYTNNSQTASWASFGIDGPLTVRVTRLEGPIGYCAVLPYSKKIDVRIKGNSVEFDLKKPGQFSVEFQRGIKIRHPLLIFADPMETDVPDPNDPGVMYFGPGLHTIGERCFIPSGKTVYLAGGAYVKGQFFSENTKNISIRGRGILSGQDYPVRTANHMITMNDANEVFIEGITIIHAPKWCVRLSGRDHRVSNVKMMGWWFSTDGIQAGHDSVVEDCFFRVNDDSIKLYNPGSVARRCVIWQMENGAPFQIGWSSEEDRSGFHAYDNDIIRVEHEWDNENEAVFCAIHGGRGNMSDYLFEDIRIDNAEWRIFRIVTMPNRWARWDPDRGGISGITFRNIHFNGTQRIHSLIMGHDAKHKVTNINFDSVFINGQKMTGPDPGRIVIDPETTGDIRFQ